MTMTDADIAYESQSSDFTKNSVLLNAKECAKDVLTMRSEGEAALAQSPFYTKWQRLGTMVRNISTQPERAKCTLMDLVLTPAALQAITILRKVDLRADVLINQYREISARLYGAFYC